MMRNAKRNHICSMIFLILVLSLSFSSAVSAKTVAKIGSKKYSSLQAAVNAVKKGQTIRLQCDVNMNKKSLVLNKKTNYTIDLNKNTISNVKTIKLNAGNVTIKNGTLKLSNIWKNWACTYLSSGTVLTVKSLDYTGSFQTAGTARLYIKGGTYRSTYLYNYGNKAYVSIDNGKFMSLYTLLNNGCVEIHNGTFNVLGAEDSGFMIINGEESNNARIYVYGGKFQLKGIGILLEGGRMCVKPAYKYWRNYAEFMGGAFCILTS